MMDTVEMVEGPNCNEIFIKSEPADFYPEREIIFGEVEAFGYENGEMHAERMDLEEIRIKTEPEFNEEETDPLNTSEIESPNPPSSVQSTIASRLKSLMTSKLQNSSQYDKILKLTEDVDKRKLALAKVLETNQTGRIPNKIQKKKVLSAGEAPHLKINTSRDHKKNSVEVDSWLNFKSAKFVCSICHEKFNIFKLYQDHLKSQSCSSRASQLCAAQNQANEECSAKCKQKDKKSNYNLKVRSCQTEKVPDSEDETEKEFNINPLNVPPTNNISFNGANTSNTFNFKESCLAQMNETFNKPVLNKKNARGEISNFLYLGEGIKNIIPTEKNSIVDDLRSSVEENVPDRVNVVDDAHADIKKTKKPTKSAEKEAELRKRIDLKLKTRDELQKNFHLETWLDFQHQKFACPVCQQKFSIFIQYQEHLKTHPCSYFENQRRLNSVIPGAALRELGTQNCQVKDPNQSLPFKEACPSRTCNVNPVNNPESSSFITKNNDSYKAESFILNDSPVNSSNNDQSVNFKQSCLSHMNTAFNKIFATRELSAENSSSSDNKIQVLNKTVYNPCKKETAVSEILPNDSDDSFCDFGAIHRLLSVKEELTLENISSSNNKNQSLNKGISVKNNLVLKQTSPPNNTNLTDRWSNSGNLTVNKAISPQKNLVKEASSSKNVIIPIRKNHSPSNKNLSPKNATSVKKNGTVTVNKASPVKKNDSVTVNKASPVKKNDSVTVNKASPVKKNDTVTVNKASPVKKNDTVSVNKASPVKKNDSVTVNKASPVKKNDSVTVNKASPVKKIGNPTTNKTISVQKNLTDFYRLSSPSSTNNQNQAVNVGISSNKNQVSKISVSPQKNEVTSGQTSFVDKSQSNLKSSNISKQSSIVISSVSSHNGNLFNDSIRIKEEPIDVDDTFIEEIKREVNEDTNTDDKFGKETVRDCKISEPSRGGVACDNSVQSTNNILIENIKTEEVYMEDRYKKANLKETKDGRIKIGTPSKRIKTEPAEDVSMDDACEIETLQDFAYNDRVKLETEENIKMETEFDADYSQVIELENRRKTTSIAVSKTKNITNQSTRQNTSRGRKPAKTKTASKPLSQSKEIKTKTGKGISQIILKTSLTGKNSKNQNVSSFKSASQGKGKPGLKSKKPESPKVKLTDEDISSSMPSTLSAEEQFKIKFKNKLNLRYFFTVQVKKVNQTVEEIFESEKRKAEEQLSSFDKESNRKKVVNGRGKKNKTCDVIESTRAKRKCVQNRENDSSEKPVPKETPASGSNRAVIADVSTKSRNQSSETIRGRASSSSKKGFMCRVCNENLWSSSALLDHVLQQHWENRKR